MKRVDHQHVQSNPYMDLHLASFPGSSSPHSHTVQYATKNWGKLENVATHISQRCVVFQVLFEAHQLSMST